jgi:thiamine kinase-like enzyme
MNEPKSPSEITTEWLNKALFPEISDGKIVSMEIDENFGPWSLLGKAIRVKLNYATPECEPKSVIVKFQVSTSEPKREGEIYELLSKAKVSYIPRVYSVFGNGNLVLEDLTVTHFVAKEITIVQARNVISIIADINNRFWGDSHVPKEDPAHFINSININFKQGWDAFKERYEEQLGKEADTFLWMWKNSKIVAGQYDSGPTTLNHEDVNRGNLLFPKDGSDRPMLIDWQLAGQKVLPFDLSYFLVKSLTVEQRREYENELLKEYYALLSEQIRTIYSFDRLILDYRACLTRSMLSAVTRMGPKFDSQPERFKSADKLATRVIEAVRDLKPVDAISELEKRGWLK